MDNNWLLGALCHSLVMQFVCWCTCMDNNWLIGALCYSPVMQTLFTPGLYSCSFYIPVKNLYFKIQVNLVMSNLPISNTGSMSK